MTYELYIRGCASCGKNKADIAALQNFAWRNGHVVKIKDSRYNAGNRAMHAAAIERLEGGVQDYPAVLVYGFTTIYLSDFVKELK